jgi:hypothetical protein
MGLPEEIDHARACTRKQREIFATTYVASLTTCSRANDAGAIRKAGELAESLDRG